MASTRIFKKGLTELEQGVKTEKNGENISSAQSRIFSGRSSTIQEAVEYAFNMMAKRLPEYTTQDIFLHDLKFKGLGEDEAKVLFDKLMDEEGKLLYNGDGWLVKV